TADWIDHSAMIRLLSAFILLILIYRSAMERLNCTANPDDESHCAAKACPLNNSTMNAAAVSFNNDFDPRFDQWLNLRIIGGACVTQSEITEAYLKLIYIYSCIFPIIQDKSTKDMEFDDYITLGQILQLDQDMQIHGRTFLHRREENDSELIKRKIGDFMKDLIKRNEYKSYRIYEEKPEDQEASTVETSD
ncbi:hypothetical protein PMAYCL1PPCAC_30901, partial [Pristionchus mayeri]